MSFWSQCKIYLAIESANELAVQTAITEITRLIKEEIIRLQKCCRGGSKALWRLSQGISHQSPVISTIASEWLKNILVYIF